MKMILMCILVCVSLSFGGGIYDVTTGKWTDTSTNLAKENEIKKLAKLEKCDFEVSAGYYGLYSDVFSMNGFMFGMGGKGDYLWIGADVGVGFYKDSFDSIEMTYDDRLSKPYKFDTTQVTVKCTSINPLLYIGSSNVKCGMGSIFLWGDIDSTLILDVGFSTGIKLSLPVKSTVSPFISGEFTRIHEGNYFGLKLGLSFKS